MGKTGVHFDDVFVPLRDRLPEAAQIGVDKVFVFRRPDRDIAIVPGGEFAAQVIRPIFGYRIHDEINFPAADKVQNITENPHEFLEIGLLVRNRHHRAPIE